MSYKISKELFEAVMNVKLTTDLSIAPYYNEVNGCEEWDLILINYNFIWIPLDTFFFKCKEWAYKQECELLSGYRVYDIQYKGNNSENKIYCDCKYIENGIQVIRFKADSEQQAVFDTCQWILDNKDKQ